MATPKWTEERTQQLVDIVGDNTGAEVSQAAVAEAAEALGTSDRSVASKLRKMEYTVQSSAAAKGSKYTEEQEATLRTFVTDNSGQFTYAEIASAFEGGAFSAKQIQGKILSMQLTEHVKPTPPKEVVKHYTDAEEITFVKMVRDGATVEELAEALGKEVNSVRGKALSLLRKGEIDAVPKQATSAAKEKVDALEALGDVSSMTVEAIAEAIGKTPRGVKTMLTRRRITVADYDGAAKAAKAEAAA